MSKQKKNENFLSEERVSLTNYKEDWWKSDEGLCSNSQWWTSLFQEKISYMNNYYNVQLEANKNNIDLLSRQELVISYLTAELNKTLLDLKSKQSILLYFKDDFSEKIADFINTNYTNIFKSLDKKQSNYLKELINNIEFAVQPNYSYFF